MISTVNRVQSKQTEYSDIEGTVTDSVQSDKQGTE